MPPLRWRVPLVSLALRVGRGLNGRGLRAVCEGALQALPRRSAFLPVLAEAATFQGAP